MSSYKLSDAVRDEGYTLEVCAQPWHHAQRLGNPLKGAPAVVCEDGVIACLEDSWDHCYSVAHEIAEAAYGFEHSADMFCRQANILARWAKQLAHFS
jgi:hypothetical protein